MKPQEFELEIPDQVAVMTLPRAVLFPQAVMPLYIFEPRYRRMLQDVLEGSRLFAVAQLDEERMDDADHFEPFFETATIGIIRASHENSDGTSNLVLQGLSRVQVLAVVQEEPYRIIKIAPLNSLTDKSEDDLDAIRGKVNDQVNEQLLMNSQLPEKFAEFLNQIKDYDNYIDLAAYTLCPDPEFKQQLLEDLDTFQRFEKMLTYLVRSNSKLRIERRLQGDLEDDDIDLN